MSDKLKQVLSPLGLDAVRLLEILFRGMFGSIGLLLLGAALYIAAGNLFVMATYEHVRAEVIESGRIGPVSSKGFNRFWVQVRFQVDGKVRTSNMSDATTNYAVGDVIDIYYKPETAYKVLGDDFQQMWFHCVFLGAIALIMLFFALRRINVNK